MASYQRRTRSSYRWGPRTRWGLRADSLSRFLGIRDSPEKSDPTLFLSASRPLPKQSIGPVPRPRAAAFIFDSRILGPQVSSSVVHALLARSSAARNTTTISPARREVGNLSSAHSHARLSADEQLGRISSVARLGRSTQLDSVHRTR